MHRLIELSAELEAGERVEVEPYDLRYRPNYDLVVDRVTHWYMTTREWVKKITMMDASDEATGPALCYVRNDLPTAFEGSVTVDAIHFATSRTPYHP